MPSKTDDCHCFCCERRDMKCRCEDVLSFKVVFLFQTWKNVVLLELILKKYRTMMMRWGWERANVRIMRKYTSYVLLICATVNFINYMHIFRITHSDVYRTYIFWDCVSLERRVSFIITHKNTETTTVESRVRRKESSTKINLDSAVDSFVSRSDENFYVIFCFFLLAAVGDVGRLPNEL